MLENPIVLAALICFFLGLALSGLARVVRGPAVASVVLPMIFLASYVLTYQQLPDFPPIGATNKIFYIAVAAALVGFALDLLPRLASYRKLLAVIMPLLILAWIGFPRFAKPDIELIATALGLWLGGIALLWRLEIIASTTPADRRSFPTTQGNGDSGVAKQQLSPGGHYSYFSFWGVIRSTNHAAGGPSFAFICSTVVAQNKCGATMWGHRPERAVHE